MGSLLLDKETNTLTAAENAATIRPGLAVAARLIGSIGSNERVQSGTGRVEWNEYELAAAYRAIEYSI
jgi:hypothetical protein